MYLQLLQLISHLAPIAEKLTDLLLKQACLEQHPLPSPSNPPWASRDLFTPTARGEQLMAAVMAMAQPSQQISADQSLIKTVTQGGGLVAAAQEAIAKVGAAQVTQRYLYIMCCCSILLFWAAFVVWYKMAMTTSSH